MGSEGARRAPQFQDGMEGSAQVFYVYAHFRADDGRLFYIGKGSGKRAWSRSSRNRHWRSVVARHGFRVRLLRQNLTEVEAFRVEALLIAARRASLATYTDGGPGAYGYRHTEEAKRAMSEKRAGRQLTMAARSAMSATIKSSPLLLAQRAERLYGDGNPARKPKNRAASSERMTAANPMVRAEVREKMARSIRGRTTPDEVKQKISAALKGRKRGPMPAKVAAALQEVRNSKKRPVATSCGLIFESTLDAARATGVRQGNIVNNCAGRAKSAGGFQWRYADAD